MLVDSEFAIPLRPSSNGMILRALRWTTVVLILSIGTLSGCGADADDADRPEEESSTSSGPTHLDCAEALAESEVWHPGDPPVMVIPGFEADLVGVFVAGSDPVDVSAGAEAIDFAGPVVQTRVDYGHLRLFVDVVSDVPTDVSMVETGIAENDLFESVTVC